MKEGKDGSGGPRRPPSAAIADPRFAKVHTDPRFMRMPKNKSKVAIDSRFSHMFSDKNFSDPLGVDKRGKAKKKKEKHMLERYYKVGEDNEGEPGQNDDTKLEPKLNVKGKKPGEKVSIRETPSKEPQKVDVKKKKQQKKKVIVAALKNSTSDDDDDGEGDIDLNSDESEEENIERYTGAKAKKHALQHESESGEEEDGGISDSGSESDDDDHDAVASASSSSSSSSESEAESDLEEAAVEEEKVPTTTDGTRRIAMMNMDWEHIKAVDLFMLMRSFLPKGGRVDSVTVYPSEFGIEQMKTEEVHGPKAIYDNADEEEENNKEIDMEKLRAYEKNKLKYYYAVVECDSKSTADHLYKECDGMEFERTSNTIDLRFIPDDMKFVRDPRDVAKDAPVEYKAPLFETRALQHSNVKLTWDDDEPTRVKALRRKFNSDQLNEMDFKTYLGSESSEEDGEDGEGSEEEGDAAGDLASGGPKAKNARDKYRSLLLGDSTEEATDSRKKGKGDVDMEVTFHTGLSELSDKLLKKQEEKKRGDEGVWEAYLRKKKEKKAQKKRNKNAKNSDDDYSEDEIESPRAGQEGADPFFTHDDNGFDDPFFADVEEAPKELKASKSAKPQHSGDEEREKRREEKEQKKKEEERSKAELELLLMDDEGVQGAARGFNLKSKKDKKKKEKGKKKKGKGEEGDAEEDDKLATANLDDPRFASLFTSHHYAIDPTNPQFRKSAAQLKILAESQKRRSQKSQDVGHARPKNLKSADDDGSAAADASGTPDRKRKAELSSMVRSLKRKVGGRPGINNKGKKS